MPGQLCRVGIYLPLPEMKGWEVQVRVQFSAWHTQKPWAQSPAPKKRGVLRQREEVAVPLRVFMYQMAAQETKGDLQDTAGTFQPPGLAAHPGLQGS